MQVMETLLNKRWIVRALDKELYYKTKEQAGTVKKFITEKLGYQLIINPYIIKLEKLPAKAEGWMGIAAFNEKMQYVFLCMILMFLEDKEVEEQFILSELTEYIQGKFEEEHIDWALYQNRRSLVKVIKYCVEEGMVLLNDGSEDLFISGIEGEVLYENTGASRYFMRNFTQNILEFNSIRDFEKSEWIDVNEERGIIRRQRVYRRLLLSPGLYKEGEEDEDFVYIKHYRNMIASDFNDYFDCELQVHKTSAYLILQPEAGLRKYFPAENSLSDIVLLCNQIIYKKIQSGVIQLQPDEYAVVSESGFQTMIEECKETYGHGMIKAYREKTSSDFYRTVKETMEYYGFIEVDRMKKEIIIRPVIGKIQGFYPENYKNGGNV